MWLFYVRTEKVSGGVPKLRRERAEGDFRGCRGNAGGQGARRIQRRPLKNIPFFRFISITHKKSTSFDYSGGFFVIRIKFPIISGVISVYFSFISLMIRLRFTANIAIAPCISMLMRPDDDAVS